MYIFFQIYYNNVTTYFSITNTNSSQRKNDRDIEVQSFEFVLSF